ncbi:MAG: adaptor protein MecA [Bacillaceae bacterium]
MDIERVNDHTVKLYMSYRDMEERGLNKEDIWEDRDKSEQLFWDMINEINLQDEFVVEGPLWIQVQVLDKGVEIVVTKAQLSNDGKKIELPIDLGKKPDIHPLFSNDSDEIEEDLEEEQGLVGFLVRFEDIEDIISLAHRIEHSSFASSLFMYENNYYLYFIFDEFLLSEDDIDMFISYITEYGNESTRTIHWIEEYGKKIIEENALEVIANNFPLK